MPEPQRSRIIDYVAHPLDSISHLGDPIGHHPVKTLRVWLNGYNINANEVDAIARRSGVIRLNNYQDLVWAGYLDGRQNRTLNGMVCYDPARDETLLRATTSWRDIKTEEADSYSETFITKGKYI